MVKKLFCIFLSMLLVVICGIPASASSLSKSDAIRAQMIACGLPEDTVRSLPDSEIEQYENIVSGLVSTHHYRIADQGTSAESVTYVNNVETLTVTEISEEEWVRVLESVSPQGLIGDSYLTIYEVITPLGGRDYKVSAFYSWDVLPFWRLNDYFALTIHDSLALVPDTEYSASFYDLTSNGIIPTTQTVAVTDGIYYSGIGGHCMSVPLLSSNSAATYSNFHGYIGYTVRVAEVGEKGTINFAIYTIFAHRKIVPAISLSVDLNKNASASFSPATNFDFMTTIENYTHIE